MQNQGNMNYFLYLSENQTLIFNWLITRALSWMKINGKTNSV